MFRPSFLSSTCSRRARLGLIVPKRLARAAALRNAIKRQGSGSVSPARALDPPCDLVLRLKQALPGLRARDGEQRKIWRAEMETLLGRVLT
jgi:RNase P protein component